MLGALEERHRGEPLAVIGVHSGKFAAEQEPGRIREAIRRYGVRHPVVVDRDYTIWRSYGIRSWPTLVFIRPDGTLAAVAPGEADLQSADHFVHQLLDEARSDGSLASTPYRTEESLESVAGPLLFPGKIIPLGEGGLAVSDSGHHRILLLGEDGELRAVIGSGKAGLEDGPQPSACFTRPQGLATDGQTLYVADTGNHALRAIDLKSLAVSTLAGNGTLGRVVPRGFAPARELALRSPWDLAVIEDYLLIAMAGIHQIWAYLPREEAITVLAGSGAESIEDGPFEEATFSQPTGLAAAGNRVYVADSETSAVRCLDLDANQVRTLVGKGLFDFGDMDGPPEEALLQHVQGVSFGPNGLLVADTYNDKIKRVDVETGRVETWYAGSDELKLSEPGGLCQIADGRVLVADTNRHRVVLIEPGKRLAEALPIRPRTVRKSQGRQPLPLAARPGEVGQGELALNLTLHPPAGYELASGARVALEVSIASGKGSLSILQQAGPVEVRENGQPEIQVPLRVSLGRQPVEAEARVHVETMLCSHGEGGACWPVGSDYRIPLRLVPGAPAGPVSVSLPLPRPDMD